MSGWWWQQKCSFLLYPVDWIQRDFHALYNNIMGLFLSPPEIKYTTILLRNSSTTEAFSGEGGIHMSLLWVSNAVVSRIEEEAMSLCGYHSICDFSHCCSLRGRHKRGGKGRGREKSTKVGKGKGAPAIRAGFFVIRPPFSQLIR